MRGLQPNPAWTDRILKAHWDSIQRSVGKHLMPKWAELGEGHYGVVFQTRRPGVVMKITSDPDEARFVVAALSLEEWPAGIVRYYKIARLPETYRRRPVYAIWREEAVATGHYLVRAERAKLDELAPDGQKDYLRRAGQEFFALLSAWLTAARRVRDASKRTRDRRRFLAKIEQARRVDRYETATEFVQAVTEHQQGRGGSLKMGVIDRARGVERLAIALDACRIVAELMEHTYASQYVGEALRFYLERDILLADVHQGNIGEVVRPRYGPMVVITDPGHAVFLTSRYDQVLKGVEDPKTLRRKVGRMKKPKPNPKGKRDAFRRLMRI